MKFNGGASKMRAGALAAACVLAGVMGIGGCGDTSMEAKTAMQKAEDAGRLARSAGDLRPKAGFQDELRGKSTDESKAFGKSAAAKVSENAGAWQNYFDRTSRSEDLKTAVAELNAAAGTAGLPSAIQASISAELGTVTGQQASEMMGAVQDKVLALSRKSIALQDQASYVIALSGQADVQDARAKVQAADTAAVEGELTTAKGNVGKAQGVVDDLTKQIADRRARAGEIYTQSEAAYQAAEQLVGNAAVEAGRKMMEARKEGDKLSAEAATLGLQLSEAQSAQRIAQIQQKEAETKLAVLQSGNTAEQTQAKGSSGLATDLRGQATKLVEAASGLKQAQKEFSDLAAQIDKDLKDVLVVTAAADKAYATAVKAIEDSQAKIAAIPGLDTEGALSAAGHDTRAKSLVQLQQAAAKTQTGQVNLMAAEVAMMRGSSEAAVAMAQEALSGKPRTAAPASAPNPAADGYKTAASKEFKAADQLANTATGASKQSPPVQWLGLSIEAAAKYGVFIADNDKQSLGDAQAAAAKAMELNPYLRINALAGNMGASAPTGAAAPGATTPPVGPAGAMPAGGGATPSNPAPPPPAE